MKISAPLLLIAAYPIWIRNPTDPDPDPDCTGMLPLLLLLLIKICDHIVASGHVEIEDIWTYGNKLQSTHCRKFYLKLWRPAYFSRSTQLLLRPVHDYEQWQVLHK